MSGSRDDARVIIGDLLAPHGLLKKNSSDCRTIECVTFSIDDARELREWQNLAPSEGSTKTYIVYADFITPQAENALLKTFEEPTQGTHIIFSLPNAGILLPTLLSRVRLIESNTDTSVTGEAKKFIASSLKERMDYVSKIVEKDDEDDASALVRGRALSLLNGVEKVLSSDVQKNPTKLETILKFKKYLQVPGASTKMILETLALVV